MQEYSVFSQALSQLLFQIPVLLAAIVGLFLLVQKQDSLGAAKAPAFIGLALTLVLTLFGPFYQAWITKLAIQQGIDASKSLYTLSSVATNLLWAVSILCLVIAVFMGRNQPSPGSGSVE